MIRLTKCALVTVVQTCALPISTRIGPIGHEKISFTGGIAAGFPIIGLSRAIFKHGPQPDSLRRSRYDRSMHRLFVAIRPPPAIRVRLLGLMHGIDGARWQDADQQIGRASWRESVCQYGLIPVVAVALKKKK